jgi:hypothetical protein
LAGVLYTVLDEFPASTHHNLSLHIFALACSHTTLPPNDQFTDRSAWFAVVFIFVAVFCVTALSNSKV